jgi:hypothetical protein
MGFARTSRMRAKSTAEPSSFVSVGPVRYAARVPPRWLSRPPRRDPEDALPDVRDGLTRLERVVLTVLHETQRELGGRNVPTAMLYGRVAERMPVGVEELQRVLQRLGAGPHGAAVDPAVRRGGSGEEGGR